MKYCIVNELKGTLTEKTFDSAASAREALQELNRPYACRGEPLPFSVIPVDNTNPTQES